MSKQKIGVFGCGNMGRSLVLGMSSQIKDVEFFLYTPSGTKARELARDVGGIFIEKLEDMPLDLDWYLLAFKPQSMSNFDFQFSSKSKILSVLAGASIEKLNEKFGVDRIARLMPNTPSSIGLGANLLFFHASFSKSEKEILENLLGGIGHLYKMETEKDLDLTTAFSGSGPALLFELARIFESELTKMTGGRVPAKDIVAQTFFGSAGLMKEKKESFEELRDQVTSKKGVTYEALQVLKSNDLEKTLSEAFHAAYNRVLELSK